VREQVSQNEVKKNKKGLSEQEVAKRGIFRVKDFGFW